MFARTFLKAALISMATKWLHLVFFLYIRGSEKNKIILAESKFMKFKLIGGEEKRKRKGGF